MKELFIKIGIGAFGALLGLGILMLALEFIPLGPKGSQFDTIQDLQAAILSPETGEKRSTQLRDIINPDPQENIIYDLRPNVNTTFQKVSVKTNSYGMRGPEISVRKPPNTYRIALLGDSFAFGWGVEENETFAHRLEENLNRIAKGKIKFEVLNFGVPGYSTFQEVEKFKVRGSCFKPDAVIVYFVQNDFGLPFFIRDVSKIGSAGLFTSTQFANLLNKQDERAQEAQAKQKGWDPNSAFAQLSKLSKQEGFKVFLAINPRDTWKKDLGKLWYLRKDPSVTLIRLREDLLTIVKNRNIPEPALTLADDPHPSPIRHAILGDLMTPYFLDVIP